MATDTLSRAFAALADPTRRAILERLAGGEATAGELAAPFAMSQQAVSQHLKVLEQAGLISRTRAAPARPCALAVDNLDAAAEWIGRPGSPAVRSVAASTLSALSARSRAAVAASAPVTPSAIATRTPVACAESERASPLVPVPLSRIARWKSPLASGEPISAPTLMPPADSPKIVTRDGSPPKRAMLSRTHCSAAI